MRGPPERPNQSAGCTRITPAYAGTTIVKQSFHFFMGDHPRLCGDHKTRSLPTLNHKGSPPLMRGPQMMSKYKYRECGITPAYAGTTCQRPSARSCGRDHPRLCGDHHHAILSCSPVHGSPPLMRGPRFCDIFYCCLARITPAYAGTTGTSL